jgi:very-short-patch-repair endonuclease
MTGTKYQSASAGLWELARSQHGVVARAQLMERGLSSKAIVHRIHTGRLHPLWRGVYAVGRPDVDQRGRWMAAVLSCGPRALLSHRGAAALWGLARATAGIDIVVPVEVCRRRPGIKVHRRVELGPEVRRVVDGIPVTDPVTTLVDFAACAPEWQVEKAINEADRLDRVDPEALRAALGALPPRPGMACMRRLLGGGVLTDTGLERKFLRLARAAGLPQPETQAQVNGYRVDFYWPDLGLIVEADGWRYHRTPGAQASDRRRDQAHMRAGLTALRFGESQIRHEPQRVKTTLSAVAARLLRAR